MTHWLVAPAMTCLTAVPTLTRAADKEALAIRPSIAKQCPVCPDGCRIAGARVSSGPALLLIWRDEKCKAVLHISVKKWTPTDSMATI